MLKTPDGHYFVVRGRLWRCTNPHLKDADKKFWTHALMHARRQIRQAPPGSAAQQQWRAKVQEAKEQLGERGPIWWDEGPVCDRRLVHNTEYAAWYASLEAEDR